MKSILEFSLPEDREDFETYVKAWDYKLALCEVDTKLRAMSKYEDNKQASVIREMFWEIMNEYGIELS